jgi:hypothetical protein
MSFLIIIYHTIAAMRLVNALFQVRSTKSMVAKKMKDK